MPKGIIPCPTMDPSPSPGKDKAMVVSDIWPVVFSNALILLLAASTITAIGALGLMAKDGFNPCRRVIFT